MPVIVTLTIEVSGKTEEEVRDHLEDIRDDVEGLFETDLKSFAEIETIEIKSAD